MEKWLNRSKSNPEHTKVKHLIYMPEGLEDWLLDNIFLQKYKNIKSSIT